MLKKSPVFTTAFALLAIGTTSNTMSAEKITAPHNPQQNIWKVIGAHINIDKYGHRASIKKEIRFFLANPDELRQMSTNAAPYVYYIYEQIKKENLPTEIALLPFIESDYKPKATSYAGAVGLWQFMRPTARDLGIKMNWWYDGRRDIVDSTHAALKQLKYLHSEFGSWALAYAAYNTGDGNVRRAIRINKSRGLSTDYWSLPLAKQTREYVPKLLALALILSKPEVYKAPFVHVANKPYFAHVKLSHPISLANAAKMSQISYNKIQKLNPGFKVSKPPANQSYQLLIPLVGADNFKVRLANNGIKVRFVGDTASSVTPAKSIPTSNSNTSTPTVATPAANKSSLFLQIIRPTPITVPSII